MTTVVVFPSWQLHPPIATISVMVAIATRQLQIVYVSPGNTIVIKVFWEAFTYRIAYVQNGNIA